MTYQQYVDHVLADSPLLYWPLVDDANDASGNAKHATLAAGSGLVDVLPTACRGGGAFEIPAGSTGSEYASWTGTLDTNAGNGLSVEFWLRVGTAFVATSVKAFSDTGANKFQADVSSALGSIRFSTSGSTGRITVTDGTTPLGVWAYWVFTQSAAGSSRVYKNGVLVDGPTTQTVGADFPDFKLSNGGQSGTSSQWQHVAVFNKELTAQRIADRYAILAEDLHAFTSPDTSPVIFDTSIKDMPYNLGTPPPTQGQLWPRGNP